MVDNLALGLITPPVGACLYLDSGVLGLKIEDIIKDLVSFYILLIAAIGIIIYIPDLSMIIPKLVFK